MTANVAHISLDELEDMRRTIAHLRHRERVLEQDLDHERDARIREHRDVLRLSREVRDLRAGEDLTERNLGDWPTAGQALARIHALSKDDRLRFLDDLLRGYIDSINTEGQIEALRGLERRLKDRLAKCCTELGSHELHTSDTTRGALAWCRRCHTNIPVTNLELPREDKP